MARRKRLEGPCRICGTHGPLSWEHVPPESAFNGYPVVRASREQIRAPERWNGERDETLQRGSGAYTLCVRCNNNTGAWYGAEYAAWAKQAFERLARIPLDEEDYVAVPFRGRPLRFLKQAVTMFFSVNSDKFASIHPELVKFVLDRRETGLPPTYKFDLVLVRPGRLARSSGVYGAVDVETGRNQIASEIAHYPFAVRMIFGDAHGDRRGAIESFARFGADEEREVWVYTIAGHVATKYPGDYRSEGRVDEEAGQ